MTQEPTVLPMFPLGSVLFPGMALPLHVFEPRYRTLVDDCLAGEPEFGVVLIERGSEVGGGDLRRDVGTVARIVEAVRFDDGRWGLGCVGVRRVRVDHWLPDDPYPRAEIADWEDEQVGPAATDLLVEVTARLRQVLAATAELGLPAAPATLELADDPVLASYQASALAPFGPADHHDLLAEPGPEARLAHLRHLLVEETEYLERRLAMASEDLGPPDDDDRPRPEPGDDPPDDDT
ncbi:LON peptidase substrate-binding domain-containing protein [Rhabdothermincola salaria]|uniref:LON peptidase substrate-binding domain-containing protein n=1 Tax=Rhabdothermincola salaria TaxID=2903142 RepID=UPI001E63A1AE|nr:LON peptidase substrate-binding domain-containing protein [Rhabdothermincola salaria]MCD9623058.1 LON peptidase substrate-binding domain-containing protein [Rhabdothermincola salaria]